MVQVGARMLRDEVHPFDAVDPGTEAEDALLVVEREVGDIHLAAALQFNGHGPRDRAVIVDHNVNAAHESSGTVVCAGNRRIRCKMAIRGKITIKDRFVIKRKNRGKIETQD